MQSHTAHRVVLALCLTSSILNASCSVTCSDGSEPDDNCYCGNEQLDRKECVPADPEAGPVDQAASGEGGSEDGSAEEDGATADDADTAEFECAGEARGLAGTLSGNVTWHDGSVCVVLGELTIAEGARLTIEAGAVVKLADRGGLTVQGDLVVLGSAERPVVFTSVWDRTRGGDTESRQQEPAAGAWSGISFTETSSGALQDVEIHFSNVAVSTDGASPELRGITVRDARTVLSSAPSDIPVVENWGFARCTLCGQLRREGTVSGDVTWDQSALVQVLASNVTVAEGGSLGIGPGVVVKSGPLGSFGSAAPPITVLGAFRALGTAEQPVVLTSRYDDGHGGDTNADEGGTAPGRGYWGGLVFEEGSSGELRHTSVHFARELYLKNADVDLESVTIAGCTTAISAGPDDDATLRDVEAIDCVNAGMLHRAGTIVTDVSWLQTELTHTVTGSIVVAPSASLTLGAGITVKLGQGDSGSGFSVDGVLQAIGTSGAPIVLTSFNDDQHGGDINGDEGATEAAPRQWAGVTINDGGSAGFDGALVAFARVGIANRGGELLVTGSTFAHNATGLAASGGATTEVHASSFEDNDVAIDAMGAAVDATDNWWGDAAGPAEEAGDTAGQPLSADDEASISYDPALDARPDTPK